jgi:hypothetical protein
MLTPYWRAGRFSGVLPVANGGTNATTLTANKVMVGNGTSGVLTPTNLHWDNTNSRLGIGTSNPIVPFEVASSGAAAAFRNPSSTAATTYFNVINIGTSSNGMVIAHLSDGSGYFGTQSNTSLRLVTHDDEKVIITFDGRVGIGQSTPTAVLNLKQGTASPSTAPLKFTSGTILTIAEEGVMEFNGTNLFFTPSTTRHTVNHGLTGSATLDFASTNAQNSRDMTIAVTGAADGDVVSLGVPNAAVNANTSYSAWVSAANTVTVRFNNYSSGTVDPASGSFKVFVTIPYKNSEEKKSFFNFHLNRAAVENNLKRPALFMRGDLQLPEMSRKFKYSSKLVYSGYLEQISNRAFHTSFLNSGTRRSLFVR